MSNWSQQQDKQELFSDESSRTRESDTQQYHSSWIEPTSVSNDTNTSSLTTSENENKIYDEQLRTTDVVVNLFDCMQCYVEIPRCEVNEQGHDSNPSSENEHLYQIQELQEQQEIATTTQSNQSTSAGIEEENYCEGLDVELFNPMNTFIIIDLPWPRSSERYNGK
ncbi:unnamed protein product [Rotaria sp. Silwood2]|nr:unnamed protein product [Rotaria sp. Silwood2]CAF2942400.1 unnamed protein product [Rotaria sp. Silwood2]CAF3347760.1 unnamed protein product [Rotaria sp. Silwood2]CAF4050271.1 unnamed protein product [Rotaria sp. Silwood2]CAF4194411.1 unnamed protein product [Rotaria sp. Silwood2]